MEKIKRIINKHFDLDISDKTRKFEYVFARACYYKICRDFLGLTFHSIGKSLNKSHCTVLYAIKELPWMAKSNPYMLKKYNSLMKKYNMSSIKETIDQQKDVDLQRLLVDYNLLLLENSHLKHKVEELTETIYLFAEE